MINLNTRIVPSSKLLSLRAGWKSCSEYLSLITTVDPWILSYWDSDLSHDMKVSLPELAATEKAHPFSASPFAAELLKERDVVARQSVLRWSPFWLDKIAGELDLPEVPDFVGPDHPNRIELVVLYRLSEIFLEAIRQSQDEQFENARILLLRQRFRFLARLFKYGIQGVKNYLPDYDRLIRKARREYSEALLKHRDQAELALIEADLATDPVKSLDLDDEISMLLFKDGPVSTGQKFRITPELWRFAQWETVDRLSTDILIREWLLAQDDLAGANRAIQAAIITSPSEEGSNPKRSFRLFLGSLMGWFWRISNFWIIISALLSFIGLLFSIPDLIYTGFIAVGVGLPLAFFLTVYAGQNRLYVTSQLLYPLALRIPGMALVGILVFSGLADQYVRFTFTALTAPGVPNAPGYLLLFVSLSVSLAYIFFEALIRTKTAKKAFCRALYIWFYGLAATFLMALFSGWMAGPIGLLAGLKDSLGLTMVFLCQTISFDYVVMLSALSLLVGVFTQIFWEDKAIAEPL